MFLGGGKFQSKKALEERKKNNEALRSGLGPGQQSEQEEKVSAALEEVGKEHGVESVTTIALAYVMQKAPNVYPIVGGRKIQHLHDNIKALSIHLTDKQIEKIEAATPFDIGFPGNFVGVNPHITGQSTFLMATTGPVAWQKDGKPIGHE